MKKPISEDTTKLLTKWVFSWNFLGFVIYCMSVVMTVGIVLVGIFYFTDYFFHTNILSLINGSHCGYYAGGLVCVTEKLTIKIVNSWMWIIIIIPIVITIFGSRKYDKKYD
jgi:hypothetical protein